jgi:hypothetical protein
MPPRLSAPPRCYLQRRDGFLAAGAGRLERGGSGGFCLARCREGFAGYSAAFVDPRAVTSRGLAIKELGPSHRLLVYD